MASNNKDRPYSLLTVPPATIAWVRASTYLFISALEANRAVMAAFGSPTPTATSTSTATDSDGQPVDPSPPEDTYRDPEWIVERSVDARADLKIGDTVRFTKAITDDDVKTFGRISGDTNQLHFDGAFAEETRFDGRIVHGTLLAGLISAALARLPGLTIYLSQALEFHNPVRIGETVTGVCEVVERLADDRFRLRTTVENADGATIIDGEAVVLVDPLPASADDAYRSWFS